MLLILIVLTVVCSAARRLSEGSTTPTGLRNDPLPSSSPPPPPQPQPQPPLPQSSVHPPGQDTRKSPKKKETTLNCAAPQSTRHLPVCQITLRYLSSSSSTEGGEKDNNNNSGLIIAQLPPLLQRKAKRAINRTASTISDTLLVAGISVLVQPTSPEITLRVTEVTCENAGSYVCEVLQIRSGEEEDGEEEGGGEEVEEGGGGGGRGGGGKNGTKSRFGGKEECRQIVKMSGEERQRKNESGSVLWQRSVLRVEEEPGYVTVEAYKNSSNPNLLTVHCSVDTTLQVTWVWEVRTNRDWAKPATTTTNITSTTTTTTARDGKSYAGACGRHHSLMTSQVMAVSRATAAQDGGRGDGVDAETSVVALQSVRCYVIASSSDSSTASLLNSSRSFVDYAGYYNLSVSLSDMSAVMVKLAQQRVKRPNFITNGGLGIVLVAGTIMASTILIMLLVKLQRHGSLRRFRSRNGGPARGHHRRRTDPTLNLTRDGDRPVSYKGKRKKNKDQGGRSASLLLLQQHHQTRDLSIRDPPDPPPVPDRKTRQKDGVGSPPGFRHPDNTRRGGRRSSSSLSSEAGLTLESEISVHDNLPEKSAAKVGKRLKQEMESGSAHDLAEISAAKVRKRLKQETKSGSAHSLPEKSSAKVRKHQKQEVCNAGNVVSDRKTSDKSGDESRKYCKQESCSAQNIVSDRNTSHKSVDKARKYRKQESCSARNIVSAKNTSRKQFLIRNELALPESAKGGGVIYLDQVLREISAEAQLATERILSSHRKDMESLFEGKGNVGTTFNDTTTAESGRTTRLPVHSRTSFMTLELSEKVKATAKEQHSPTGFPRKPDPPKSPTPPVGIPGGSFV